MKREVRNIVIAVILTFVFTVTAGLGFVYYGLRPLLQDNLVILEVMRLVQKNALQIKERNELVEGAIQGILGTLQDPFTYYLNPESFETMQAKTEGYFGGIGVEMGMEKDGITVIAPIEGTPAEKAGIRARDRIIEIDGKSTKNMTLEEAARLIRGPENTKVELSIMRPGRSTPLKFELVRDRIPLLTVRTEMLKDGIGYLRLSMFSNTSAQEVRDGIAKLKKQGMKGLIIDLRNNPGGVLEGAVEIGQQLVPEGPIVSIKYRTGQPQVYRSQLKEPPFPMVVLINEGSASASEILSGALQDTKAAVIVGTRSFGKGLVQSVHPLSNGGGLALTVAEYVTPKGRHIHGKGITPDVVIDLPENAKKDVQLEKAVEILQDKLNN